MTMVQSHTRANLMAPVDLLSMLSSVISKCAARVVPENELIWVEVNSREAAQLAMRG